MATPKIPALSLLFLALLGPAPAHAEPPAGGPPPSPVRTVAVREGEVQDVRTFVGQIEPRRRARVASEYEGLVVERLVDAGDIVTAGQPLVRLRTADLERHLEASRAVETERSQELLELENGARAEERRESQARAELERTRLDTLRWKLEASEVLRTKGAVSEDQLRDARLEARLAEQRVLQSEATLALVLAGPREERVQQAKARVAAQKADVRRLEEQLERMTLRAPFAGHVVALNTEVGQWIGTGDAAVEIVEVAVVDAVVPVVEDYVTGLRPEQSVTLELPAIPGRLFEGRIHRIVQDAGQRTRALPVRIRLDNPDVDGLPLLAAGMFVRARIPVGPPRPALLVPKDALVLGGDSPVVWVLAPGGGTARPVPVQVGASLGADISVTGGLVVGDRVVVEGNERIFPGVRLIDTATPPKASDAR